MRRLIALAVAVLFMGTAFGVSAFTTGYADRTATIDVVADPNGLVGLDDGNAGDQVGLSGDELTIDFGNTTGATGANTNGYFELGDPANGNQTYAFNVTNNDGQAHALTLNYTLTTDDGNSAANVTYEVYDSTNNQLLTASEESTGTSSADAVAAGETVHVVIKVDTNGMTSGDDLSGTLRVKLE